MKNKNQLFQKVGFFFALKYQKSWAFFINRLSQKLGYFGLKLT